MKKLILSLLLSVVFFSATNAQYGTERSGFEGDYFNLEGALELFKNSRSIEDFERRINTEDNWINNLDINYDGRTDYIRIEHRRENNFHAIILQALVSRNDVQDVAVIEIEKLGRRDVVLQIVGDADLYGEEVIIEPYSQSRYPDAVYSSNGYDDRYNGYSNVYDWAPVQFIFHRSYHVYVSPFHWGYTPRWWRPWNQYSWHTFHPHMNRHHHHFHRTNVHRVVNVHHRYKPHRAHYHKVAQRTNKVRKEGKVYGPRPSGKKNVKSQDTRNGGKINNGPRSGKTGRDGKATVQSGPRSETVTKTGRSNAKGSYTNGRTNSTRGSVKPSTGNVKKSKTSRTTDAYSNGRTNSSKAVKPSRSNDTYKGTTTKPSKSNTSTRSTKTRTSSPSSYSSSRSGSKSSKQVTKAPRSNSKANSSRSASKANTSRSSSKTSSSKSSSRSASKPSASRSSSSTKKSSSKSSIKSGRGR